MASAAYLLAGLALVAIQAAALLAMGRPAISTSGTVKLWVGDVASPENSQQLTDWYTFTHLIHGILFYALLWVALPATPFGLRLVLAIAVEAMWEIAENSPRVIGAYRQQALAQGYVGDSVLNSLSDTLAAVVGFALAALLPVAATIVLALALEGFVGWMIRDNLTLNVIQLLHRSPAISRWQTRR